MKATTSSNAKPKKGQHSKSVGSRGKVSRARKATCQKEILQKLYDQCHGKPPKRSNLVKIAGNLKLDVV